MARTKEGQEEEKKEGKPTVSCPKRVRTDYGETFELFWSGYPTDANMSKKQAYKIWQRLDVEERQKAIDSLPAYRAYCQANTDYRPKHAEGYLSQAKYDGHLAVAQRVALQSFHVSQNTPQWRAWEAHYRRTRGQSPPMDTRGGWNFPTEWPPAESAA